MADQTPIVVESEYIEPPPPGTEKPQSQEANVVVRTPEGGGVVATANAQETAMVASAVATLQLQARMARENPRSLPAVKQQVYASLQRFEFADKATYRFKIGTSNVVGPSVYLAEELARHYGNMTWGHTVIDDTPTHMTLRCYAWDLQTNNRKDVDVQFAKKVQRKQGTGPNAKTIWVDVSDDPRQLLMLTNMQASKGVRNALLKIMPDDLVRAAVSWATQSFQAGVRQDPERYKQNMLNRLAKYGVTVAEVEALVGKKAQALNAEDLDYLKSVGIRLAEGHDTWQDIVTERAKEAGRPGPPPVGADQLKEAVASGAAQTTKGARRDEPKK